MEKNKNGKSSKETKKTDKVKTQVNKELRKVKDNNDKLKKNNFKEKNDTRVVPKKNYIILVAIYIICIFAILGIKVLYRNYKEYRLTIPVIQGKISEINMNELDEYIVAHDDFYLYVGVSSDKNCREIEKDLVKLLESRGIKDETVYLNVSETSKAKAEVTSKLSKYGTLDNNFYYPLFIIFKDGKIMGILNKQSEVVNIGDVEKLLDEYEVGIK